MDYEPKQSDLLSSLNEDQLFADLSISDLEARLAQEPLEPRMELGCLVDCAPHCTWNS